LSRGRDALRRLMGIVPDRQAEIMMADPAALRRARARFQERGTISPLLREGRCVGASRQLREPMKQASRPVAS
jgi:hypothetical protein